VINQEKQIYMDVAFAGTAPSALGVQPFSLRDSTLCIRAEPADPVHVAPHIWNYRYTSGCITSELTHWQTYGYFEMRARLPLGKGFWPAFWLLPKADHWPPEIDVFEASGARPFAFRPAFAPPRKAPLPKYGCWMRQQIGIHDGFHVYAMEWTPDTIRFGVDGEPCFETGRHDIHEDMYLLANLALGSHDPHWIPDPDASTSFPGVFEIDFIRSYRRRKVSR
jgi:beta-glucanase (GH16 family)